MAYHERAAAQHRLEQALNTVPLLRRQRHRLTIHLPNASFLLSTSSESLEDFKTSGVVCASEPSIAAFTDVLKNLPEPVAKDPDRFSEQVLRHLYTRHGKDYASRIESEHAACIWDANKNRLFLSIDRYGSKNIYYTTVGKTFVFCNEIAPLYFFPGVSADLDPIQIADFLLFGKHNQLSPERTPYRAIASVPPAGLLTLDPDGQNVSRYWHFPTIAPRRGPRRSETETLGEFSALLSKAIKRRISGKKVILALSGGLDSTTTASLIPRGGPDAPSALRSFTVSHSLHDEEFTLAQLTARHLGIPHELFTDQNYSLLDDFPPLLFPTENPFPRKYLDLSHFTSERSDIVLTAGAADNLLWPSRVTLLSELRFSGPLQALRIFLQHKKIFNRRIAIGVRQPKMRRPRTIGYPKWLNSSFEEMTQTRARWRAVWESDNKTLNNRHPEIHEAMAHAVWNRDLGPADPFRPKVSRADPFFDIELLEFVLSLPSIPWLIDKAIIRRSAAKRLPVEVIARKKTPARDHFRAAIDSAGEALVNVWRPHPILDEFIDLHKVEPISPNSSPLARYLNYRVIAFNRWLHKLDQIQ